MKIQVIIFLAAASLLTAGCVSGKAAPSVAAAPTDFKAGGTAEPGKRLVTYSGWVDLESDDPEGANGKIRDLVLSYKGFVTRSGSESSLVRVPSERLPDFVKDLGSLGTIKKKEINGQDITDYYSDLVLRLESQKKLREKYLQLLEKAKDVQDLLAIEKELERINTDIESLEGRKAQAEKQVDYATVTIRVSKRVTPGPLGWIFYGAYSAVKWLFVWD